MNVLAQFFGCLAFSLDVGGRKTKWVLKVGDTLISRRKQQAFRLGKKPMHLPPRHLLRLWNYAPININRTYRSSALWQYVATCLPKDARFIDIASNIGGYLKLANERGMRTLGVEANPELGPVLEKNKAVFGEVRPVALGASVGVLPFHISDLNPGGSSLVESNKGWENSGYSRTVEVPVTTLDKMLQGQLDGWKKIHLVKIGVEGGEEAVIRGMEKCLCSGKIEAIWCEVRGPESDRNPNSALAVNELLSNHGYRAFCYDALSASSLSPFDPNTRSPQYFDLLFVNADGLDRIEHLL